MNIEDQLAGKDNGRLFSVSHDKYFYYYIMIGNEGLEGFACDTDFEKIHTKCHVNMKLRCRFNSHRDLELYVFRSKTHYTDMLDMIDHHFLKACNAIKLY